MATQEDLFFYISPPTVSSQDAKYQVLSTATGAAAASYDWIGALPAADAPQGPVMLLIEALTQDMYVRFGNAATTGTTSSNGLIVKAGQPGRVFYCHPIRHRYIDHIAGGVGTMKVQVSSPIGPRVNQ